MGWSFAPPLDRLVSRAVKVAFSEHYVT